jgi:ArsR family transcriptional regulator, arsenate/arsenite/antimonite-responsive transcriptional repressor
MSMQRCCPPGEIVKGDFESAASLLKALSDQHRLKMIATLAAATDDICVCDFTDALPLNQPTISHHLRILREAELVTSERRGTWVYYRLATNARERIDETISSLFRQKVLA